MVLIRTSVRNAPPGHRDRLLAGMAAAIREQGFARTTIADVVRHARTSRRTFYEHFEDREACFLELLETTGRELLDATEAAVDPAAGWAEQVDQAVDGYLEALALDPGLAVSFARELPLLGAPGVAVQRRAIGRFADLCLRLANSDEHRRAGAPPVTAETVLMLIGGLNQIVLDAVERGEPPQRVSPVARDVIKAVLDPARPRG